MIARLQQRAILLGLIRHFFANRNVLEVETPLACHAPASDPFLRAFSTELKNNAGGVMDTLYLQTSPEYAMKRLLSEGSGSIYQICKAFRNEEMGAKHNPEFTILEWYRVGFTHHDLMDEMVDFIQAVVKGFPEAPSLGDIQRLSYEACFKKRLDINPHEASKSDLIQIAKTQNISVNDSHRLNKDDWLMILMDQVIEPTFEDLTFVYDYPASQAALAQIKPGEPHIAERFEVYWRGVELANGFHELTDPKVQRERFEEDNRVRAKLSIEQVPVDERLLEALEKGMPACAGVALGVDRLLMILTDANHLQDVLSFSLEQA